MENVDTQPCRLGVMVRGAFCPNIFAPACSVFCGNACAGRNDVVTPDLGKIPALSRLTFAATIGITELVFG